MKTILILLILAYNLYPQQWKVVGEMPHPVYGAQAVVKDSLIYIIGGFSEKENSELSIIQSYNPKTGQWYDIAQMKEKRYGHFAGLFADSLVIVGGTAPTSVFSASMEFWDFSADPQEYDSQISFTRKFASGIIVDDDLYVFGGINASLISTYFYKYNLSKKKISESENFIFVPLFYPFQQIVTAYNKDIFIFGGGTNFGITRSIYKYNSENKNHEKLPVSLNISRAAGSAVVFMDDIYIIGGYKELNQHLGSVDIFEIGNDNEYDIKTGPELVYPRSELMSVVYDNSIYVLGGKDDQNQPVKQIEKLETITSVGDDASLISSFELRNNYPNPFNPSTTIEFNIPADGFVTLNIYNSLGELIAVLLNDHMSSGLHSIPFIANGLTAGIYFYEVAYDGELKRDKMILLK